ncbi:hypothetical protein D9M70_594300 [compost metagenome]
MVDQEPQIGSRGRTDHDSRGKGGHVGRQVAGRVPPGLLAEQALVDRQGHPILVHDPQGGFELLVLLQPLELARPGDCGRRDVPDYRGNGSRLGTHSRRFHGVHKDHLLFLFF